MNHYQFLSQNRYLCLDGLRCISVLAVIWHHTGSLHWQNIHLAKQGFHGVSLFFVISGFLITSLLLAEKRKYGTICLKSFYIRRTLRIFPLYYSILALYVILVYTIEPNSEPGTSFFSNLKYFTTYTTNIFVPLVAGERVIFYFVWSLAVEEQFYLVWPTIEKKLSNKATTLLMIIVIVILSVLNSMALDEGSVGFMVTKVIVMPICFGVLLAHLLEIKESYKIISLLTNNAYSSIGYFMLMIGSLSFAGIPEIAIYLSMTLFLASCVTHQKPAASIFLDNTLISKVGQISYGMYLMHMLAYNAAKKILVFTGINSWLLLFMATIALSVIAALISYHFFESYFLNLKSKFRTRYA